MSATTTRSKVFANLYKDSVSLMQLTAQLREREGVAQASCVMATPANLAQLKDADLAIDVSPSPSDLLVVVRGEPQACDDAIAAAEASLQSKKAASGGGEAARFNPNAKAAALWTAKVLTHTPLPRDAPEAGASRGSGEPPSWS